MMTRISGETWRIWESGERGSDHKCQSALDYGYIRVRSFTRSAPHPGVFTKDLKRGPGDQPAKEAGIVGAADELESYCGLVDPTPLTAANVMRRSAFAISI